MSICRRCFVLPVSPLLAAPKKHDELHKGRFGFPVSNFLALTPLNNAWCNTWTEFFERRMSDQIEGLLKVP